MRCTNGKPEWVWEERQISANLYSKNIIEPEFRYAIEKHPSFTGWLSYDSNTEKDTERRSERMFEALAIVSLNGFSKDIISCTYLNKSIYNDPYFLDTLGLNAYSILQGAAAVNDILRVNWIREHSNLPFQYWFILTKWCINMRLENSSISLIRQFMNECDDSYVDYFMMGLELSLSPLFEACRTNQLNLAKWLLDNGANPNTNTFFDVKEQVTALHICIETDNIKLFKLLIDHGADINVLNNIKLPAQWNAVKNQANHIFDYCLSRGYYNKVFIWDHMPGTFWAGDWNNTYAEKKLEKLYKSLGIEEYNTLHMLFEE